MSDELKYIDNIVKKSLEGIRIETGAGWDAINQKIAEGGIDTSGGSFLRFNKFGFNIYYAAVVVILSLLGISYIFFDRNTEDDLLKEDKIEIPAEADDVIIDDTGVGKPVDAENKEITPAEKISGQEEGAAGDKTDAAKEVEEPQDEAPGREAGKTDETKVNDKETAPVKNIFNVYDTVNMQKKLLFQDTTKTIIFEEQ